jgi:hypothetical protein
MRRQKGSEVHLSDALKVPTEFDEARLLAKADLDQMSSKSPITQLCIPLRAVLLL